MITIKQVQKVIGADTVLDIGQLEVEAGAVVAVFGPRGSGKLTLLGLLTGQTPPTAGQIRVAGLIPGQNRAGLAQQVGVLFAENTLYPHLSVRENLRFHATLRHIKGERVEHILGLVGLRDQANISAGKLPHSLARRLAFGRAILHNPDVLFLVDPFNGCNTSSVTLLSQLIQQLADADKSILILTSESTRLNELCDLIYELSRGQIMRTREPQSNTSSETPFKIPVRLEGRVVLLNPTDVLYVSTQDSKTSLHTREEAYLSQFTMQELESRLERSGFFRAHRSYLVNLQQVQAVIPYTRNSYSLVLDDTANTEIPLSKSAARELRELLDY